jgi:hypothetical protein
MRTMANDDYKFYRMSVGSAQSALQQRAVFTSHISHYRKAAIWSIARLLDRSTLPKRRSEEGQRLLRWINAHEKKTRNETTVSACPALSGARIKAQASKDLPKLPVEFATTSSSDVADQQ